MKAMRVLFYLPVVTPWWFDNIVEPLLRCLAGSAAVHVLAPEPWRGTGIGARELARCADLPMIGWTLIGGDAHPSLRTTPVDPARLFADVAAFAPDHVLCRSADLTTPVRFPGRIHYLMEGGVPPFPLPAHWIWLADAPFAHGMMPALDADDLAMLEAWIAEPWDRLRARVPNTRRRPGEPLRLCLPLDYEHEENFFLAHRPGPAGNAAFVRAVAATLADGASLTVTNHPLNELYVDRDDLDAAVAELSPRVALAPETRSAVAASDGVIVADSKAFALAALNDRPLCRLSRFPTAPWVNAYTDPAAMQADLLAGTARRPDPVAAKRWSAWHLANNVFDPQDAGLTARALIDRLERAEDRARWPAAMGRVSSHAPELFA